MGKKNVWVGTGSTPLELTQVKAQGKKAMRAADWARGARLSPPPACDNKQYRSRLRKHSKGPASS